MILAWSVRIRRSRAWWRATRAVCRVSRAISGRPSIGSEARCAPYGTIATAVKTSFKKLTTRIGTRSKRTAADAGTGGKPQKLNLRPARRRLLAGMDRAALLAGARLLVGEERLVERRQVAHQVRHLDLDAMHQRAAFEAVPFERVHLVVRARFGSTTSPIEPAGRCGECRTCGGSRNTSPSLIGTS